MNLKPNKNIKFLGRHVIYYETIDSTQLEIWRRVQKDNIQNGTVLVSDIQTNGKRNTWQDLVYK